MLEQFARRLRKRYRYLVNARMVTIDGVRIISDRDRIPERVRGLLYRNVYEDTERNLLMRVLRPGMKVVEIGAGIGFIGALATKICGEGNVLCYEANAALEPLLRENFALNGLRANLRMRAVTADGRQITFYRNDNIISSSVYDRQLEAEKIVVDSDPLASVLAEFAPTVLILDVEGAEAELLRRDALPGVRHLIVELHPHIVGEAAIDRIVADLQADGFTLRERDRKATHFERLAA